MRVGRSGCADRAIEPGSAATIENRLRYLLGTHCQGDAHEKNASDFGDGCLGWRHRHDRAGAGRGAGHWPRTGVRPGRGRTLCRRRSERIWSVLWLWSGLRLLRLRPRLLPAGLLRLPLFALRLLWPTLLLSEPLLAPLLVTKKPGTSFPGFFFLAGKNPAGARRRSQRA